MAETVRRFVLKKKPETPPEPKPTPAPRRTTPAWKSHLDSKPTPPKTPKPPKVPKPKSAACIADEARQAADIAAREARPKRIPWRQHIEELNANGLFRANFVWPMAEWLRIVQFALAENKRPNAFVWDILAAWLAEKEKPE